MKARLLAAILTVAMLVASCLPAFAQAELPDGCSEAYAGAYRLATGRTTVWSDHARNGRQLATLEPGDCVWVSRASGTGSGQVGHIRLNQRECFLAMDGLEPLRGLTGALTVCLGKDGYLETAGYAFDWADPARVVTVRLCVDGEEIFRGEAKEYDGTALKLLATDEDRLLCNHYFYKTKLRAAAGERTVTLEALHADGTTTRLEERTVTVLPRSVQSIRVATPPTKTTYHVGDPPDPAGLVLEAVYSTDETALLTEGFSCTPEVLTEAGSCTVTVTCEGRKTTFAVEVLPAETAKEPEAPEKPESPEPPEEQPPEVPEPSAPAVSGGDGGMGILLGGAVLVVGGAAMLFYTLPFTLRGQLCAPDGTAVPDAVLTLQKDGRTLAQTVSAADGSFAFEQLRRGEYELVITPAGAASVYHRVYVPARNAVFLLPADEIE